MKMKALLASGLCLALTFPLLAQEKINTQDSVYITPVKGSRIVLTGKGMESLIKENNLEVLKNKFIEDYRQSATDKDFPADAKNIIYLAGQDGRRRLKVIPEETAPLNVKEEIASFSNNLPPFHYTIYDLTKNFEYHIYTQDPDQFIKLADQDCSKIVAAAVTPSANGGKQNWVENIEIVPADTTYRVRSLGSKKTKVLAISLFAGLSVINSNLSPAIGIDLDYYIINKYGKPCHKIGINQTSNLLASYVNKSFTNFYQLNSYNLHYLFNISQTTKEHWIGFTGGMYLSGKFKNTEGGSLHKAWQVGITSQFNSLGVEFTAIRDRNKQSNGALTIRYYF